MARPSRFPWRKLLVLGSLAVLVLGATLPPPQVPPTVSILQVVRGTYEGNATLTVTLAIAGGSRSLNLTALLFPLTTSANVSAVHFYMDPGYPVLGNPADVYGVLDHLTPALRDRGYRGTVDAVDTAELVRVLQSNDTPVVVLASTAVPAAVLSNATNLLTPWLDRGGILVWTGDLIGGYIGEPGQTSVAWDEPQNLQWEGERKIFGSPVVAAFAPEPGNASVPTWVGSWLGLRYPLDQVGAHARLAAELGGFPMGFESSGPDPSTSIAWVPVGRGGVVLFGYMPVLPFGVASEDVIANDIAQILVSGAFRWNRAAAPGLHELTVAPGNTTTITFSAFLPAGTTGVRLYAYSAGPLPIVAFSDDFGLP